MDDMGLETRIATPEEVAEATVYKPYPKIRPLQDRVVVERIEAKTVSDGGIILPEQAQERPQMGTVLAVGNGKKHSDGTVSPLDVQVGDQILFGKYSGSEVEIENQTYIIMYESDILGIIV